MKVKVKKRNKDGIVKLESGGEIKEFIFKEDLLNKDNSPLLLCFKGKDSSGIIELEPSEIERLHEEIQYRNKLIGETSVVEFDRN